MAMVHHINRLGMNKEELEDIAIEVNIDMPVIPVEIPDNNDGKKKSKKRRNKGV